MSDKSLEIFKLCERLAELLDDQEAIADVKLLFERHRDDGMFNNQKEVANLIKKVISIDEPDIVVKNPTPRSEKDFITAKKLDNEKMGEVGLKKDENITKIFHANRKRIKNFDLLAKKETVADGRNAHTSYTQAQSLDGRLVENNISSTTNKIIPQNSQDKATNSQNEKNLSDAEKKAKQKAAAEKVKEKQKTQKPKQDRGFDR